MISIKVNSCAMCPFVNTFYDAGRNDGCNYPGNKIDVVHDMPRKFVHPNCPLKENTIVVKL